MTSTSVLYHILSFIFGQTAGRHTTDVGCFYLLAYSRQGDSMIKTFLAVMVLTIMAYYLTDNVKTAVIVWAILGLLIIADNSRQ